MKSITVILASLAFLSASAATAAVDAQTPTYKAHVELSSGGNRIADLTATIPNGGPAILSGASLSDPTVTYKVGLTAAPGADGKVIVHSEIAVTTALPSKSEVVGNQRVDLPSSNHCTHSATQALVLGKPFPVLSGSNTTQLPGGTSLPNCAMVLTVTN